MSENSTQITNQKKLAISYRSVPTFVVNAAIAVSIIFFGLWTFWMIPQPVDNRIAPPEFNPPETSASRPGEYPAFRVDRFLQELQKALNAKLHPPDPRVQLLIEEEFKRESEERNSKRNQDEGNESKNGLVASTVDNNSPGFHRYSTFVDSASPELFELRMAMQHMFILIFLGIMSGASLIIAMRLRDRGLRIGPEGILFPSGMLADLEWRRKRAFADISAIGLSGSGTPEQPYAIQIYFNSGGKATLFTERLSRTDLEDLFLALDTYAAHVLRSPELVAFRQRVFDSSKNTTFTQLWEQELYSHFAATNFVALSPESKLQNGKIKIVMHLSSGGLSAVYLAERSKSMLVVKESVVPQGTSQSNRDKAREMFKREASMLMNLNHPKIAKVLDHFQENDRDYLLLEYIPGITLREYIRRHGPQPEQRVCDWTRQIAEILEYLHKQDPPVIHRDLTPDNLMITPSGDLVLIDFGAANLFLGNATGTIIGKQFYISPEQFKGKAEPASDLYSLAGTMHYLLTGKDPEALASSHPRSLSLQISVEMDALVAKCSALKAEERFASAAELIHALDGIHEFGKPPALTEEKNTAEGEKSVECSDARVLSTKQKEALPQ